MKDDCEICGGHDSPKNRIMDLEEMDGANGMARPRVHLCSACLKLRRADSWSLREPEGGRLLEALTSHPEAHGRFTYLSDGQKIHLLRLRPKWVRLHAEWNP